MLGFYGDIYGDQWEIVPPDNGGRSGNGYSLPPTGYFPDSEPGPTPGPTPYTEGPPPGSGPTPYDTGGGNGGPTGVAPGTGPSTALYLIALGVALFALAGGRKR